MVRGKQQEHKRESTLKALIDIDDRVDTIDRWRLTNEWSAFSASTSKFWKNVKEALFDIYYSSTNIVAKHNL